MQPGFTPTHKIFGVNKPKRGVRLCRCVATIIMSFYSDIQLASQTDINVIPPRAFNRVNSKHKIFRCLRIWCPGGDLNPAYRQAGSTAEKVAIPPRRDVSATIRLVKMVPRRGLEPPRPKSWPLAPQASVSTNFTTWAYDSCKTRTVF